MQVLDVVRQASATIRAPIVMFTYYNPIMARGLDKFCRQAKEAGASGVCGWGRAAVLAGRRGRRDGSAPAPLPSRAHMAQREGSQAAQPSIRLPAPLLPSPCTPQPAAAAHLCPPACLPACLPVPAGLLVPDIPLEETPEIRAVASQHGLELVLLTTPTTPQPRMRAIAESSQGFVYLVSLTGAVWC